MSRILGTLTMALFLGACVTINIYFPAAQAQQAAEKIVDDILQKAPQAPAPKEQGSALDQGRRLGWVEPVLDFLVSPAHAGQPDFSVDSPAIRQVQARLKARNLDLAPFFAQGALGLTADGKVALRDATGIGLRDRPRLNGLIDDENRDRAELYRAIAEANGHPEWAAEVQAVFARTWIEKAAKNWYYQDRSGAWMRK